MSHPCSKGPDLLDAIKAARGRSAKAQSAFPGTDIIAEPPGGDEGAPRVWPCCAPHRSSEVLRHSPLPVCSHPQDLKEQLPLGAGL